MDLLSWVLKDLLTGAESRQRPRERENRRQKLEEVVGEITGRLLERFVTCGKRQWDIRGQF